MNIDYDKNTDALYIKLGSGIYKQTKKITDAILVDIAKDGSVMGIEILDASDHIHQFDPKKITAQTTT